jgi:hypothetical protein
LICSINILLHNAFWTNTTSALLHQERTCALLQRAVLLRKFAFEVTARASSSDDLGKTLETMTVKELRDFLKSSALNERGVISRLKLKKELVQYLKENIDPNRLAMSSGNFSENVRTDALKRKSNSELRLPTHNKSGAILKMMRMPHGSNVTLSMKEASFERVFQQYPPLREQGLPGIVEDDIRQTYHPIFENDHAQLTGDMDLIFVGTASCTPGVSRGVSCTALRLNWNRQPFHGVPGAEEKTIKGFNGGTWLFDCGECTQVRLLSKNKNT